MGNFLKSNEFRFWFDNATFPRYLFNESIEKHVMSLKYNTFFANRFADKNHFICQKSDGFCRKKKGTVVAGLILMPATYVWFSLNRIELSSNHYNPMKWITYCCLFDQNCDLLYPFTLFWVRFNRKQPTGNAFCLNNNNCTVSICIYK